MLRGGKSEVMGEFIAKQPNGLYCRYSEVVDNITHHNMTEEEYIELCADRARREAWKTLKDAKPFSEVLESLYPDTRRDLEGMNKILKECGSEILLKEEDYEF